MCELRGSWAALSSSLLIIINVIIRSSEWNAAALQGPEEVALTLSTFPAIYASVLFKCTLWLGGWRGDKRGATSESCFLLQRGEKVDPTTHQLWLLVFLLPSFLAPFFLKSTKRSYWLNPAALKAEKKHVKLPHQEVKLPRDAHRKWWARLQRGGERTCSSDFWFEEGKKITPLGSLETIFSPSRLISSSKLMWRASGGRQLLTFCRLIQVWLHLAESTWHFTMRNK